MSSKPRTKSTSGEKKTKPKAQATSTTNASATKDLKTRIEQLENENNKLKTELKQKLIDTSNWEHNLNDGDYIRGLLGKELHEETKKSTEDLRKQIQDLETDRRNLETEILLLKNDFNIQRIIKDLETKGGIQDQGMLELCQDNILGYLRLQKEKLENSSITSNQKPTETQDQSQTEEKLSAAMKKVKIKDQKIMELENDIKKLTDKLKALEVHNSHSSERKKTDDNLKEAQREWENKYNAEVKKKETELNQIRKKVDDLEAEAKKQSSSSEQEKTIKSLKEAQTEWQNKYKSAVKEKEDANDKLEKMKKKMEQLEAEANNLWKSKDTGLKERNEKLSTELINVKRKYDELEKEKVRLQKKLQELEKEKVRLQKSQGIHDMGSDELASSVADVCAFCASKGKLNPALYNCKACTEFGRYICGCCKENHDLYTQHNAARISTK